MWGRGFVKQCWCPSEPLAVCPEEVLLCHSLTPEEAVQLLLLRWIHGPKGGCMGGPTNNNNNSIQQPTAHAVKCPHWRPPARPPTRPPTRPPKAVRNSICRVYEQRPLLVRRSLAATTSTTIIIAAHSCCCCLLLLAAACCLLLLPAAFCCCMLPVPGTCRCTVV